MTEEKICECCNVHTLKKNGNGYMPLFCIRCVNIKQNERSRLKAKEKYWKERTPKVKIKKCVFCENDFIPVNGVQKKCNTFECLQKQKIEEEKCKFLKEKVDRGRQDLQNVTYSFFRKKYGISKKFNACRG